MPTLVYSIGRVWSATCEPLMYTFLGSARCGIRTGCVYSRVTSEPHKVICVYMYTRCFGEHIGLQSLIITFLKPCLQVLLDVLLATQIWISPFFLFPTCKSAAEPLLKQHVHACNSMTEWVQNLTSIIGSNVLQLQSCVINWSPLMDVWKKKYP